MKVKLKPSDLRLGNLIQDGNDIEAISVRHLQMMVEGKAEFDPILLTEEILLKFGCSNIKGNDQWFINYFGFCLDYDGEDWCLKPRADEPYLICYIKYVHEFQNIYFSLSREEIEFKP